jgi:hypothetical protein
MLKVVDARLPASLNGRSWPIQRVAGELKAGNDFRVYTLEFGDAPIDRFFQKYRATPGLHHRARHLPARKHRIYMPTHHLRPSTSYVLTSQMVDEAHRPVRQAGVTVVWSLEVRDRAGVNVGGGSLTAHQGATDKPRPDERDARDVGLDRRPLPRHGEDAAGDAMTDDFDDNAVFGETTLYVPCDELASALPAPDDDENAIYRPKWRLRTTRHRRGCVPGLRAR